MNNAIKLFAILFAAILAFANADFAFARGGGGGSNLFNSPGYQRALKESRERYRRAYTQPYTQPPSVYSGRKWRHRRHHYH